MKTKDGYKIGENSLNPGRNKDLDSVCSKVARRILPLIVVMFCLSMLDRMNISFVKNHIEVEAGISSVAYALGAGLFFIGYAIFEVPSNLLLHRLGAKIWLSRIMVSWGIVTACMIFIQDEISFYILRFLLGLCEAGFSPGIIFYLSLFFPFSHRAKAYGIYQMGVPISFIFGGFLSGIILDYAPKIHFESWQWMFIVHGSITILVGIFAYFFLDNSPKTAKWLNAKEKQTLITALEAKEKQALNLSLSKTLTNLVVWKFVFIYFCIQLSVYGVIFYLPAKIAFFLNISIGFKVALLNAIPWVFVFFALPLLTNFADKNNLHHRLAVILLLCASVGLMLSSLAINLIVFMCFICICAVGFVVIQPIFWNLATSILKGREGAGAIALIGSFGNLGGFVAPNIKNYSEMLFGSQAGFLSLGAMAILGVLMLLNIKKSLPN